MAPQSWFLIYWIWKVPTFFQIIWISIKYAVNPRFTSSFSTSYRKNCSISIMYLNPVSQSIFSSMCSCNVCLERSSKIPCINMSQIWYKNSSLALDNHLQPISHNVLCKSTIAKYFCPGNYHVCYGILASWTARTFCDVFSFCYTCFQRRTSTIIGNMLTNQSG